MIFAVPAPTAVTNPAASTVATLVLLLLHAPVPPPKTTVLAEYVAVCPTHNAPVPLTEAMLDNGVTVTERVAVAFEHPPVPESV